MDDLTWVIHDGSDAVHVTVRGPFTSGLRLVQELSKSRGALRHDDGKTVWASVLPTPEGGRFSIVVVDDGARDSSGPVA